MDDHTPQMQSYARFQGNAANLRGGSVIRMGASAGAVTLNVVGASLEAGSFEETLGLLVSRTQREFIADNQE